jgi:hypothetical protein
LAALDADQPDISCAISVEDDTPVNGLDRAVAENLLREDRSTMDLARALRRMRQDGGLTVRGIAERLPALSQRSVHEHLSLLVLHARGPDVAARREHLGSDALAPRPAHTGLPARTRSTPSGARAACHG